MASKTYILNGKTFLLAGSVRGSVAGAAVQHYLPQDNIRVQRGRTGAWDVYTDKPVSPATFKKARLASRERVGYLKSMGIK